MAWIISIRIIILSILCYRSICRRATLKDTKLYESARSKREVEGKRLQQRRWQQQQ